VRFVEAHEQAFNTVVFDSMGARGGSFSAEHSICLIKCEELARRKSPVALKMMRGMEAALDPQNLRNLGRVVWPHPNWGCTDATSVK